jgi:hypothetical protein
MTLEAAMLRTLVGVAAEIANCCMRVEAQLEFGGWVVDNVKAFKGSSIRGSYWVIVMT